ncbi:MAG: hypothetical protein ACRDJ4_16525 [Actinomycetota bacterium]
MARPTSDPDRVARLLVKAVLQLPDRERDAVLEHLVGRGLLATGSTLVPSPPPDVLTGRRQPHSFVPASVGPLELRSVELLGAGHSHDEVAERLGLPVEAVRLNLLVLARLPSVSPREADILRLFGEGLDRAAAAQRGGLSEEEIQMAVEGLADREAAAHLVHILAPQPEVFRMPPAAASGRQMVPVRLAEEQHRRLKEWCKEHGFSMAVVIRGLVERFLEDQQRRAS